MKFKELAQMSAEERKRKQRDLELELMKMNTQVATGTPPKNAGTISRMKKDIARLKLLEQLSRAQIRASVNIRSEVPKASKTSTPEQKEAVQAKK